MTNDNVININEQPTICKECKNCIMKDDRDIWYNFMCGAIEVEREETIDYVTGEKRFIQKPEPGVMNGDPRQLVDEKHPYCRSVNTDGKCEMYKPKGKSGWLRK